MPERYRRYFLKAKESKDLLEKASRRFKYDLNQIFDDQLEVEVVKTEFAEILLINKQPTIVKTGEDFHPALTFNELINRAPKAVVDMGAVPYVCKGANVMAAGIRSFQGDFKKGDFVFVVDEKYGKAIALGEAQYDVEEVKNVKKGMVIKTIDFVGNRTWNILKELVPKC